MYYSNPKPAHELNKVVQVGECRQWKLYGHLKAWAFTLRSICQLALHMSQDKLGKAAESARVKSFRDPALAVSSMNLGKFPKPLGLFSYL